ncbi:MAG: RHS repeat-associated core domain-containing protein [Burkholderiales bacterium]
MVPFLQNLTVRFLLSVMCVLGSNLVCAQTTTITYFHNDISGSPMLATDASGNVVWKETYRPYGDRINNAAASGGNKLWFAGKLQDNNSGLSYMGARYYDPVIGRFLGVDPRGVNPADLHSFNRYAYGNNNPYKYVDPDGRVSAPAVFIVAAAGLYLIGAFDTPKQREERIRSTNEAFRRVGEVIGKVRGMFNESTEGAAQGEGATKPAEAPNGNRFPDRPLPRDKDGNPIPDPEAEGAHTQLGQKQGRKGKYDQAREFDANGKPVRDIDFTDHGRPQNHPNPHQHDYLPNPTGGTPQHGPPKPLSR